MMWSGDRNLSRVLDRRWWGMLLFESGQGWLRWGWESRWTYSYGYEPPEYYAVAPPLRRAWWWVVDPFTGTLYGVWDALRGRIAWSEIGVRHERWAAYKTFRDRDRRPFRDGSGYGLQEWKARRHPPAWLTEKPRSATSGVK